MNPNTCTKFIRPAASIIERADGFTIEADVPGTTRESIHLALENDTLTIHARRNTHAATTRTLHRETTPFDYRREFAIGSAIDRRKVTARFDSGVLQIFLPKIAAQTRRIEVAG